MYSHEYQLAKKKLCSFCRNWKQKKALIEFYGKQQRMTSLSGKTAILLLSWEMFIITVIRLENNHDSFALFFNPDSEREFVVLSENVGKRVWFWRFFPGRKNEWFSLEPILSTCITLISFQSLYLLITRTPNENWDLLFLLRTHLSWTWYYLCQKW